MIRSFPPTEQSTQPPRTAPKNASSLNQPLKQRTAQPVKFGAAAAPATNDNNNDYSIWRDTSLRYGGYADEVGEFLSPYLGGLGKFLGYGISSLYCMADMGTTLPKKYMNAPADMSTGQKTGKTAAEGVDLSVFHLVATLLIPPKIIGAVVQSAERMMDKEALTEARDALQDEAGKMSEAGTFKKMSHRLSEIKLAGEEALNRIVIPKVENAVDSLAQTGWGHEATNKLIAWAGPGFAKFVNFNANLAEKYNNVMPIKAFKDPHMADKLRENVKFLKGESGTLSRKDVARLIVSKPWPVLIGIGMVPLIAHPFDKLMLKVQDWTIRPILGKNKIIRGADGKLQSIHNPEFWGKPPVQPGQPTPPANTTPMNSPFATSSFSNPGLQAYPQFGTFYQPPRPVTASPSGFPLGYTGFPVASQPTGQAFTA